MPKDNAKPDEPEWKIFLRSIKRLWMVIAVVALVVNLLAWGSLYAFTQNQYFFMFSESELKYAAMFGDSFGFVNAIVSSAGFVLLVVSFMIQREEFKHQKEEFIKNTKALNDQHEEMDLANKVNMFSAIQNAASFFTEMNNYEPTVTSQKLNSIVFLKRHLKLKHIEMVVTDNLSTLGENLHEKKAGVFHQFRISNSQNFELVNAGEIFVNMHSFIRENRMMVCGSQDSGNNNVLTKSKHELAISSLEKMHESIEHIMNYLIYENGTQELVRPVNDLNTILSRVIQDDISISEWRSIYDRITKLTEQVMRVIADSLQQ